MKNKKTLYEKQSRIKSVYKRVAMLFAASALFTIPAFADDPLQTINNLSDFVFSAIQAIGVILLGWGVVQIGMSIQSHDASQRTNGFLCFFGGLLIAMSKAILGSIR